MKNKKDYTDDSFVSTVNNFIKTTTGECYINTVKPNNDLKINPNTNKPYIMTKEKPKESFKIICDLIRKQLITYDEAWDLLLDIMPKEKEYVNVPSNPYEPPYIPSTTPYKPIEIWCGSGYGSSTCNGSTNVSSSKNLVNNSCTDINFNKEGLTYTKK